VGGNSSAAFIARLVYRIAEFLPAALKAEVHVLNWTGVITGMVQMLFASEMLDYLVGPPEPEGSPRWGMQTAANIDINSGEERWFDNILDRVAIHLGQERNSLESRAKGFIGRTEAIRYVQLGSPEQILIDDGQIRARVLKEYSGREKEAEVGAKGVLG